MMKSPKQQKRLPALVWASFGFGSSNPSKGRSFTGIMALGGAGIASIVLSGIVLICALGLSLGGPIVLLKRGVGRSQPKPAFIMLQSIPDVVKVYASPSLKAKVIGELPEGTEVNGMNLVIPEMGDGTSFYRIRFCNFPDSMPYRFVNKDEMLDISSGASLENCPYNTTQP